MSKKPTAADVLEIIKQIENEPNLRSTIKKMLSEIKEDMKKAKTLAEHNIIVEKTNSMVKLIAKINAIESWARDDNEIKKTEMMLEHLVNSRRNWAERGFTEEELEENPTLEVEESLEPSLLLEWVLYRALASIFGNAVTFNGNQNDTHTVPLSTAGGSEADLEVEFDNFMIVVEATVSTGQRQYDTETEPVVRHIAELQKAHPTKKVYGIFIANKIEDSVVDYFLVYHAFHRHPTSDKNILIVPCTSKSFLDLYNKMRSSKNPKNELKKFFEDVEQTTKTCSTCKRPELTMQDFQKNYEENFDKLLKRL